MPGRNLSVIIKLFRESKNGTQQQTIVPSDFLSVEEYFGAIEGHTD